MSTEVASQILDLLRNDMVSHGLLCQTIEQVQSDGAQMPFIGILKELLHSRKVEIGAAKNVSPDYVEFIAWNGMIEDRISRAEQCVQKANAQDREFAYWLCLRENVDRYEEESDTIK